MRRARAELVRRLRGLADRFLFRLGGPETAPIRLTQRRIYVLPTRAGLGFGLALLVMLLTSINYNLSLGFGLVFLLGGLGVASLHYAFLDLYGLRLSPGRCTPVFCGDNAGFRLLVDNPGTRRRAALRLRAHGQASALFELGPQASADVLLACPARRRGDFVLGRTVLETTWPLGLIRAWSVFVPDQRCLVYPAPEPAPPPLPAADGGTPGVRGRERDGDDDFAGLRAHRAADSPRHVAWKVLARGGPVLTKQYAAHAGRELWLDWSQLPPRLDVEQRLSRLTAWVLLAEQAGHRYALTLPGVDIPPGHGGEHRAGCLGALARHGLKDGGDGRG